MSILGEEEKSQKASGSRAFALQDTTMATLSADQRTKVSTEGLFEDVNYLLPWCCDITINTHISSLAAKDFVESYYPALNKSRDTIASFYMEPTTMTDGKSLPVILFNGNSIEDPTAMQTMFKEKMPDAHYEIQTYDCHVLNPHYVAQDAKEANPETGKNMMMLVMISGAVQFGDIKSTPTPIRGFTENIVLVPNSAAIGNEKGKPVREFLIQSQNFRLTY